MSLQFRPGGFRPGELVCADCRRAVDRLNMRDYALPSERFVCDACHPGPAQAAADIARFERVHFPEVMRERPM